METSTAAPTSDRLAARRCRLGPRDRPPRATSPSSHTAHRRRLSQHAGTQRGEALGGEEEADTAGVCATPPQRGTSRG